MSARHRHFIPIVLLLLTLSSHTQGQDSTLKKIPFLQALPVIDGDLSEWKNMAHHDGVWNLERVQQSPWFQPKRNRLIIDDGEPEGLPDLVSEYYIAWDDTYLYLGAEVHDNVHDVSESKHAPKRWYYKDAIAWFIESPADSIAEKFQEGDHGFCFVIDSTMPDYGAWWRHGTQDSAYIEEPLTDEAVRYAISMNPWNEHAADYILEARIDLGKTVGKNANEITPFAVGQVIRMMIVHCDPDGGEYGGHLLIYGAGDDDATWQKAELSKEHSR